jgi:hypothetical protein
MEPRLVFNFFFAYGNCERSRVSRCLGWRAATTDPDAIISIIFSAIAAVPRWFLGGRDREGSNFGVVQACSAQCQRGLCDALIHGDWQAQLTKSRRRFRCYTVGGDADTVTIACVRGGLVSVRALLSHLVVQ